MKTLLLLIFVSMHAVLLPCPTCMGLARPGKRPFFERNTLLPLIKPIPNNATLSIQPQSVHSTQTPELSTPKKHNP